MTFLKHKKILLSAAILLILILFIVFVMIADTPDHESTGTSAVRPKGFAFLDLHADSILSEPIKDELSGKLGSTATETKTVLNLEMHYEGFLKKYFPELNQLNRQLNLEKGLKLRVEHHTTKLVYRYSPSFNYVELFFSNYTQKPLLFRIKAKNDGSDIVEAIRKKYGAPKKINWEDKKGSSLFWKQDKDVLLISLFTDRYDNPQYEIMICHVENIEALLYAEEKQRREKDGSLKEDSAF